MRSGSERRNRLAAAITVAAASVVLALSPSGAGSSGAFFTRTVAYDAGSVATRAACSTPATYPAAVKALGPTFYWRFSEAAGASTVADSSGNGNVGTVRNSSPSGAPAAPSLTFGAAGTGLDWCDTTGLTTPKIVGTAARGSFVVWPTARPNLNTFSVMAWVRTTSTTGGRVIGMSSSTWAKDVHYDRQIMLDNTGHAVFAIYPGTTYYLRSSMAVNDGKPHFLAATLGPGGAALYVDGVRDQFDPNQHTAESYTNNETVNPDGTGGNTPNGQGYWRVGWDNLNSWGAVQPTDFGLAGVIDEAALFENKELTPAQMAGLWQANHW